jgi:hypothetical protein
VRLGEGARPSPAETKANTHSVREVAVDTSAPTKLSSTGLTAKHYKAMVALHVGRPRAVVEQAQSHIVQLQLSHSARSSSRHAPPCTTTVSKTNEEPWLGPRAARQSWAPADVPSWPEVELAAQRHDEVQLQTAVRVHSVSCSRQGLLRSGATVSMPGTSNSAFSASHTCTREWQYASPRMHLQRQRAAAGSRGIARSVHRSTRAVRAKTYSAC